MVDARSGALLGTVPAVELVTVGQRRGLGAATGERRFAVAVDVAARTVYAGGAEDLETDRVVLGARTWATSPLAPGDPVLAQCSAHGAARPAVLTQEGVRFAMPGRRVAPGQLVALYRGDEVVGSGIAEPPDAASRVAERADTGSAPAGVATAPSTAPSMAVTAQELL